MRKEQLIGGLTILTSLLITLVTPTSSWAGQLNVFTSDAKGFDTHTFWYDDGKEVTVIDTQFVPQLAQQAVDHIRANSDSPITRVIITHPNPDKFNGLSALHNAGAISIASEATASAMPGVHKYKKHFFVNIAKKFTDESYPKFEPVKRSFSDKLTIRLDSGETITLLELKNPGISSTQTVVRIDATGDLLVGDLIHHNAHAWLEGGIVNGKPAPDLALWRAALEELNSIDGVKTVYGGRGVSAPVKIAVKAQQHYLSGVETITEQYIDKLGSKKSELLDTSMSGKHHAKLKELIAAEFPEYQLPYMIKYGIYGLTSKIASR